MSKKSAMYKPKVGFGGKKFTKKRLYDNVTWVEFSVRFLQENPFCYCCPERARVTDHIIPHKGNENLFYNPTNFIPLCKRHHDQSTAMFDRHVVPKTEEKMRWLEGLRQTNEITRKVKIVRF